MATTLGKEKYYAPARSQSALQKRSQQLQIWAMSDTNKQPTFIVESRKNPRVRFGETVVFMAAAQSGDVEEVERLVQEEGADANSVNKDGLTALHQVRSYSRVAGHSLVKASFQTIHGRVATCG